ncbi:hypothetical protein [Salipaludibacillus sp. CF4.18]|uniref:hypothetical protein n=1 Tax=Salipaludibacillus sp. CF4.18 TaxID=3373081 RepID=UPI003EE475D0
MAGNTVEHAERPSSAVSHGENPKTAIDIGMTRQVASAVLKGKMNADIKQDLKTEEEDRLEGLSEVSCATEEPVTATTLADHERDFNILKGILTTKSYSQLAKEAGVDPLYISLLKRTGEDCLGDAKSTRSEIYKGNQ